MDFVADLYSEDSAIQSNGSPTIFANLVGNIELTVDLDYTPR